MKGVHKNLIKTNFKLLENQINYSNELNSNAILLESVINKSQNLFGEYKKGIYLNHKINTKLDNLFKEISSKFELSEPLSKEEFLEQIEDIYARVYLFILNGRMIAETIKSYEHNIKDSKILHDLYHIRTNIPLTINLWAAMLKNLVFKYKETQEWPIPLTDDVYEEYIYRFKKIFQKYPINWSSLTIQKLVDIGIPYEKFNEIDTTYYLIDMNNVF